MPLKQRDTHSTENNIPVSNHKIFISAVGSWTLLMLQCIMGASTASEVVIRVGEIQICFLMLKVELQCVFHITYIFPRLLLAKWRPSMKPREDLGEGELDFAVLGPHCFWCQEKQPSWTNVREGFKQSINRSQGLQTAPIRLKRKSSSWLPYNSAVCVFLHLAWQLRNTP